MKRQGLGKVNHHIAVSKEDLENIQSSYNPPFPDTKSLQQVVWFNIMFHLIRRGRENLRLLTKESLAVQVDVAGKKFVSQVVDELDKNHRANDQPDDTLRERRMYETPESPYCRVKNVELDLSKLNPALSYQRQRPRTTEHFSLSD